MNRVFSWSVSLNKSDKGAWLARGLRFLKALCVTSTSRMSYILVFGLLESSPNRLKQARQRTVQSRESDDLSVASHPTLSNVPIAKKVYRL